MSASKNREAVHAIEKFGASIFSSDAFYAKIRDEEENLADEKFLAGEKNIASENNLASEEYIASEKYIAGEKFLANEDNLAYEATSTNVGNLTDEKFLTGEKNIASEKFLASEENLASSFRNLETQTNPHHSQINMLFPTSESGDAFIYNSSNQGSSSFKDLRTTTTEPDSGEKFLAGKGNLASENFIAGRRNVPIKNYEAPVIEMVASLGMASFGFLSLLRNILPGEGGLIRINALARSLGMSTNNIRVLLENLQKAKFITTSTGGQEGRWVDFNRDYHFLCTGEKNIADENNIAGEKFLAGEKNIASEPKFSAMLPWERSKLRSDAEDLFYTALAAKVETGMLSMQTLRLFEQIAEEKSKDHAMALFLVLLPKVKDNPTGYISSAIKQGAEPTTASLSKVKDIQDALACLASGQSPERIKQKIQTALDRDDTEALASLSAQKTKLKKALQLLSWNDTFEALIKKRDEFVASLLK